MVNHGIIPGRLPSDWLGGTIQWESRNPSGNWYPYLVIGEHQSWGSFDCMACVSFATDNICEIQIKAQTGIEVNHSDRFMAKVSGTTPQGNRVSTVLDAKRKQGYVFEVEWATPPNPDWNTYYAPIPQPLLDEGVRNIITFDLQYEYLTDLSVSNLQHELQHAPLLITIPGHEITGIKLDDDGTLTVLDDYIFNVDPNQPFVRKIKLSDVTDVYKAVLTVKNMSNTQLVKKGTEYGFYLPANSEQALIDKADNFGYPLPKTPDGKSVDWANVKPEITL